MGNVYYPEKRYFANYQNKIFVLTFPRINGVLNNLHNGGYLTLQAFNECLNNLLSYEAFPIIAYTHLSSRLFALLDFEGRGLIPMESFNKGLCMLLSTPEMKIKVLFEAMKLKKKNYLTFDEIREFFQRSWDTSFSSLYNIINYKFKPEFTANRIPIPPSQRDLVAVGTRHSENLYNYLVKNLYDSGINTNQNITYEEFKKWAMKDNTIEINYAGKYFRFATSLMFMEKIGLNVNVD